MPARDALIALRERVAAAKEGSQEDIEAAYRRLARERHPDRPGGSHDLMADLNRAREQGLKEKNNADR